MPYPEITMSEETIHNPDNPRHFMRAKPASRTVRVHRNGRVIAESRNALRVTEMSKDVLDPIFYLPADDVRVDLTRIEGKTSHCPLKGDAVYYALDGEAPIAWSYVEPFDFSRVIKGRIAFYPDQVIIEEIGKDAR